MPRPLWKPLAFIAVAAALPPPVLHAALAATAGTLFEAAPFVLLAEAAAGPGRRALPALAALAGCGCGERFPGALSLPATALAWLAFGPAVALARLVAGLARAAPHIRRRQQAGAAAEPPHPGDALAELAALVSPAFIAALAAQALTAHSAALHAGGAAGALLAFGAGAALGAIVPCATAGVAIAAAVAGPLPPASVGLLVSAGLFGFRSAGAHGARAGAHVAPACLDRSSRETRAARLLLAVSLAALAVRGPSGLVSPRLLPLALVGAGVALLRLRARPAAPDANRAFAPVLMAAALLSGSPPPAYRLDATEAASAFPGSRLVFTGVALASGRTTVVERFAIACCRIDASPVTVRLDRRLAVPDGAWLSVEGTIARDPAGALVLRTSRWSRVARPADPFMYR
jgi:hypothetical protein